MKLALLGNQNSGKTSLFNALTGSNQKIGNWPGVTIDWVEGVIKKTDSTIVDLPGIYSLSPYTNEEEISRQYVLNNKLDLIINLVDATSLERSLYLTTQLLELDCDVVVALNMYDLLKNKGISIDIKKLEQELGVTIVPISAKTRVGIDKLINVIFTHQYLKNNHKKIYPEDIEHFVDVVSNEYLNLNINKMGNPHSRFVAVKILEEDRDYQILMNDNIKEEHLMLENKYQMDGEQLIASLRYDYIEKVRSLTVSVVAKHKNITDKLDQIFLHKYFAIPLFILIMIAVYFISISFIGGLTNGLINALFNGTDNLTFYIGVSPISTNYSIKGLGPLIEDALAQNGASIWARGLLTKGIIGGLSAVISFLPMLITLFIFLSILETTGYMSRIAFLLDRVFHKFGLSGKSLIPFIVGAGCSVPGIMSTRIIEDSNEKQTTIALTPFVPCSAKLPIISLVCSAFFKEWGFVFALIFYFLAVLIIFLGAFMLKKILKHKEHQTFISELPNYKIPNAKYVFRDVKDKTLSFLARAGTVILFFSVIVYVLVSFTWDFKYVDGVNVLISQSMLSSIGSLFNWFFYLMLGAKNNNWMWVASVSSIQGLIAKEQVVSSLEIVKATSGFDYYLLFNPLTAFAFTVFNLFSIPCVGSISTMYNEFKSVKKTVMVMSGEIIFAWLLASLIGVWGALL